MRGNPIPHEKERELISILRMRAGVDIDKMNYLQAMPIMADFIIEMDKYFALGVKLNLSPHTKTVANDQCNCGAARIDLNWHTSNCPKWEPW